MIIHHEEVLKGMEKKDNIIEIQEGCYREKLAEISQAFHHLTENSDSQMQPFIVQAEQEINSVLLDGKLSNVFEKLNYMGHVEKIRYLFTPKSEQVNEYLVDLLTIFFVKKNNNENISVVLPCYFISHNGNEFILPLPTE